VAASLFGSSSSLQRKPKERDFTQLERRETSKKEHRVGKILMSPKGRKLLLPLLEQGLLRPQFSEQRYSKKQAPRRASSSYPRQDLQKAQEEAMLSSWSPLVILRHHLRPEFLQPRGLRMQQQLDPPE
jgi:hypothetical protein